MLCPFSRSVAGELCALSPTASSSLVNGLPNDCQGYRLAEVLKVDPLKMVWHSIASGRAQLSAKLAAVLFESNPVLAALACVAHASADRHGELLRLALRHIRADSALYRWLVFKQEQHADHDRMMGNSSDAVQPRAASSTGAESVQPPREAAATADRYCTNDFGFARLMRCCGG